MATKYYGINDKWTDDDLVNVIEVASEDGTVSSVKVNGVEYGGGGGGDFSTVQVTFSNTTEDIITVGGPIPVIDTEYDELYLLEMIDIGTVTLPVVLYKGGTSSLSFTTLATVAVTGSIQLQSIGLQQKEITITGDGTITIS